MRLLITTPAGIAIDDDCVASLRAEDESGGFGILPGHADLLTVLEVSVLAWNCTDGRQKVAALRGGVLRILGGREVRIATRAAVLEDTLSKLGLAVIEQFRHQEAEDEAARISTARLHLAAMRQLQRYLSAAREGGAAANGRPGLEAAFAGGAGE